MRSPTFSNRFPLRTPLDLQKKHRCAEILIFKKLRVGQVLAWSCFRPFPTVSDRFSDRFRPLPFFWTINWTNSAYGRLIQCKSMQTMTLNFFSCDPCALHQILINIASWPWYPIFPQNPKIPVARDFGAPLFFNLASLFFNLTSFF